MSMTAEAMVMEYLTRNGLAFVCPQFSIAWDKERRDGGSCPDLLAIDLKNRDVAVVEVTTKAEIAGLLARLRERRMRWYEPLEHRFNPPSESESSGMATWELPWAIKPRFIGFIRGGLVQKAYGSFPDDESNSDVTFFPIEEAGFAYNYWSVREGRMPDASKLDTGPGSRGWRPRAIDE